MYSTFFSVALFFTFAINAVFADFAVSTPEIQACKDQDVKVTWQPATAPYNLLIVSADDPCGDALMTIGDSQQTFTTFKPNQLQAGQNVQISIEDAEGEEGWSGEITVKPCASASSAASSSGSASADAVAVTGTTLVVTPTFTVDGSAASSSSSSVAPVGAANAAFGNDSNAAAVPRHLSIPALALTAVGGAIALLL